MGTWDIDAFGNDTAADWAFNLDGIDDFSVVEQAFDQVLSSGERSLDAKTADEGVAAAEALTRAKGNGGTPSAYTESVDAWAARLNTYPPAALIAKAAAVVDRVVTQPSELLDLWEETDDDERWKDYMADLEKRVLAPLL
jgi:hypothetical protein